MGAINISNQYQYPIHINQLIDCTAFRYAELHQKVIRDDRIPATIEVFVLSEISPSL
jgi:hypothetical protein